MKVLARLNTQMQLMLQFSWRLCIGGMVGAAEAQGQRHAPEDPDTLEQIRNLKHGCCVVMLR